MDKDVINDLKWTFIVELCWYNRTKLKEFMDVRETRGCRSANYDLCASCTGQAEEGKEDVNCVGSCPL
ncbi:CLUMA_CG018721, isoform A [Clunio marinus]|uniref:CLUMA_CG018721, isoform A n=1 Tax=Clunio marinus TaxID=568069 RepID=A0A1J1J498_9DIPT|nr:CLUMA_CG018721, isoform A [Clunio marinus]